MSQSVSKSGDKAYRGSFPFLSIQKVGKTEARQDFFNFLKQVESEPTSLKITDRGHEVAVIIGIKQYEIMLDMLQKYMEGSNEDPLAGLSITIGDLAADSKKMDALFQESVARTAKQLK
jgi:prevent-host-death family protein